ncbi:MAG: response regulator [Magnetococcus sp. DMHC-8]
MTTVLVIDDDPTNCQLVKTILQHAGYRVIHAGGGEEGLHMFRTHAVDVVITDILMPGTDGLAVIRELLTTAPDTRIIALSGGGMMLTAETSLQVARKTGAFESLAKPFVRQALLDVVKRVLHTPPAESGNPGIP